MVVVWRQDRYMLHQTTIRSYLYELMTLDERPVVRGHRETKEVNGKIRRRKCNITRETKAGKSGDTLPAGASDPRHLLPSGFILGCERGNSFQPHLS